MRAAGPYGALLWMAGCMAAAGALYLGVIAFRGVTLFRIETVEVWGNERTPTESIVETAGIARGENLYGEDLAQWTKRASGLPWIRAARISRQIPDTVRIQVEEWKPLALIRLDRLYYLTAEGHVVNAVLDAGLDYPVVTGLTWARLEAPGRERDALLASLRLLASGSLGTAVEEIHMDPYEGVVVTTGGQRPSAAHLGFEGLEAKCERLARLRQALEKRRQYARTVNVTYGEKIVARLLPLASEGATP